MGQHRYAMFGRKDCAWDTWNANDARETEPADSTVQEVWYSYVMDLVSKAILKNIS